MNTFALLFFAFVCSVLASPIESEANEVDTHWFETDADLNKIPLAQGPPGFTSCGSGSDIFDLKELDISPFPPKAGQNIVVTATGYLKERIVKGSQFYVKAKLGFITVLDQTVDLCDSSTTGACPIDPRPELSTFSFAYPIPSGTPSVQVKLQLTAKNNDGKQIICFAGPIKVVSRLSLADAVLPITN